MCAIVTDVSRPGEEKISIVVRTNHASALCFSLTYHLQPEGYHNGVSEIEVRAVHPVEMTRLTHACLAHEDKVITEIENVLRYLQYARNHLSTQRGAPLSFKKWLRTKKNQPPG